MVYFLIMGVRLRLLITLSHLTKRSKRIIDLLYICRLRPFSILFFFRSLFFQEQILDCISSRPKKDCSNSNQRNLSRDNHLILRYHLFCNFKHQSKSNSTSYQPSVSYKTKLFERKLGFVLAETERVYKAHCAYESAKRYYK